MKELLSRLNKNKSVELVAELTKDNLVAKFVRIDRMDFQLSDEQGVVPPKDEECLVLPRRKT